MFIPIGLSLSMYLWLCILAWPLRYRFDTVSSACANQNKNFLRILLVVLTCLLSTAMAAILVDEYESRGRNKSEDAFLIAGTTEIALVLLVNSIM